MPPPHQHLEKSAEPWAFHIESTLDCKKQVLIEKPLKIGNFKSFAAQTKCGANAGSRTVQGSKVSLLAAYRATCTLPCTPTNTHCIHLHTVPTSDILSHSCAVSEWRLRLSQGPNHPWSVSESRIFLCFKFQGFSFIYCHPLYIGIALQHLDVGSTPLLNIRPSASH